MEWENFKLKIDALTVSVVFILLFSFTVSKEQFQRGEPNSRVKSKADLEITAHIQDDKKTFKLGETIIVGLTIRNSGVSDVIIVQSCASLDYRLTVKNQHGHVISLTKEGQRRTNRHEMICSLKKVKIEPGKSKHANINLTSLYDLSAKGRYYVSAGRSARKGDNKWIQAESNLIDFVIE